MTELIVKIVLSLLGVLSIGFIFGYLISKAFFKRKYGGEAKDLTYRARKMHSENIILRDQLNNMKEQYRAALKSSEITDISIENIQPRRYQE